MVRCSIAATPRPDKSRNIELARAPSRLHPVTAMGRRGPTTSVTCTYVEKVQHTRPGHLACKGPLPQFDSGLGAASQFRGTFSAGFGVSYTRGGRLLHVNRGPRDGNGRSFSYCAKCRLWNPEADHFTKSPECAPKADNLVKDVVIVTHNRHDVLSLRVIPPNPNDMNESERLAWSVLYALKSAVATVLGLELGTQVFPDTERQGGRVLALYEMDEGGVGVVSRISQPEFRTEVSQRALEILHVDPATGIEQDRACDTSCYECLRTFYNQWDHDTLDRRLVIAFFQNATGAPRVIRPESDAWGQVVSTFDSDTEEDMVRRLIEAGIPAPTKAHRLVPAEEPIANADLYYEVHGSSIAVFLDGSVHDGAVLRAVDAEKRNRLRAKGFSVVEIRYDDIEGGISRLRTRLGL